MAAIVLFVLLGVVLLLTYPHRRWNEAFACKALGYAGAIAMLVAGLLLAFGGEADRSAGVVAMVAGVIGYIASFFLGEWVSTEAE